MSMWHSGLDDCLIRGCEFESYGAQQIKNIATETNLLVNKYFPTYVHHFIYWSAE